MFQDRALAVAEYMASLTAMVNDSLEKAFYDRSQSGSDRRDFDSSPEAYGY